MRTGIRRSKIKGPVVPVADLLRFRSLIRRHALAILPAVALFALSVPAGMIPRTGIDSPSGAPFYYSTGDREPGAVLSLAEFSLAVTGGEDSRIAGVFVQDVLALRVAQQPAGNPGYVTNQIDAVTQFSLAAANRTLGFLAHNYLAGEQFFALRPGQSVVIIRADGTRERFRVDAVQRYQALSPWSPLSAFVDLENPEHRLTAQTLFNTLYGVPDQVVFQTCIGKDGNPVWGRLFVLASRLDGVNQAGKFSRLEAFLVEPIEIQSF